MEVMEVSEKDVRHKLFVELFDSMKISQGHLAKWLYHEDTKLTRKYVSRKYTNNNPITKMEVTLMQLLKQLYDNGVDLKSVEFDAAGVMTMPSTSKKAKKSK
jgi:hypothetical protein